MVRPVSTTTKWISVVLALMLPVLIVFGTLDALERLRTFSDKREDKNAGSVINGRVVKGGVVGMIEKTLARTEPEVIILGNSLSNTDIQPALLAKNLGINKNKIQKFSVPNSMGAHWYAILKNRVYANGYQPKIVILLSDLQSLLALSPRSEASYLNLSVQLEEEEPVVDALLGRRFYALERVRENRGKIRDKGMITARNLMIDLMIYGSFGGWGPDPEDAPSEEAARNAQKRRDQHYKGIEKALTSVFDTSRTDMKLFSNAIPIFNNQNSRDLLPFDPMSLPIPQDSFLPHIAALVQRNGGTLVILRPPMSPLLPKGFGDIVRKSSEKELGPLVGSYGGVYLDLRKVPMNHSHFQNQDHMNDEGARRFTEILSELMQDLALMRQPKPKVDLLKSVALVNGSFTDLDMAVTFRARPPELPRSDRVFSKGRGRLLYFPTEALSFLADTVTIDLTAHASRCSPLRVLEDGEPLPFPNVGCDEVLKHGYGRTCHAPDKLFFTTSGDESPYMTGRDYTIALDDGRSCDAALWLYPGDRTMIAARQGDFAEMPRGANLLHIVAHDLGVGRKGGPPLITVRVRAGKQVRAEVELPIDGLADGADVVLEPKIASGAQNVAVEFVNASDRFLLLTELRLENHIASDEP